MEKIYQVSVNAAFDFEIASTEITSLDAIKIADNTYHLLHDCKSFSAEIAAEDVIRKAYSVRINSRLYEVSISDELDQLIQEMGLSVGESKAINDVKAPMPGMILEVNVSEGQEVKEGDFLLVLEAMKMENTIMAPRDGIITSVAIEKGQTVNKNQVLLEID